MTKAGIPKSIDLKALLAQHPPDFKYHVDDFYYILGTLTKLKLRDKGNYDDDLVSLNSTILQSRIRDYNHYLEYLVKYEVVITDNQFIRAIKKSRGYWFHPKHQEQEYAIVEIKRGQLTKASKHRRKSDSTITKRYRYLTKWLNAGLQIDYDPAKKYLQVLLENDTTSYAEDIAKAKARGKKIKTPLARYYLRLYALDLFHAGEFNPSVDDTVRRFYSMLVRIKSQLRNFITYDGQQLCSIDVKNSQPFISMILLDPEFYNKGEKNFNLHQISPSIFHYLSKSIPTIQHNLSNLSPITLVKQDESQCGTALELYCTLVDKGTIYHYISDRYKKKTGIFLDVNIPDEKKKLKQAIFTTFFSDNRYWHQKGADMKRLFKDLFPEVYDVFSMIKKGKKNNLPIILQLVESEIVIRRACKRISKLHPNLPIFTIHDSIVTLEEAKDLVYDELKQEFMQAIDVMPNLERESWHPDKLKDNTEEKPES
jgi:hypothetical protein